MQVILPVKAKVLLNLTTSATLLSAILSCRIILPLIVTPDGVVINETVDNAPIGGCTGPILVNVPVAPLKHALLCFHPRDSKEVVSISGKVKLIFQLVIWVTPVTPVTLPSAPHRAEVVHTVAII